MIYFAIGTFLGLIVMLAIFAVYFWLRKGELEDSFDDLIEDLSDIAHEAWSGWMKYMFEFIELNDGKYILDKDKAKRWLRQMDTIYDELSEQEKESDRVEGRKYLAAVLKKYDLRKQTK